MHKEQEHSAAGWSRLEDMKEHIDQLAIPTEIDESIRAGMRIGRQRRRNRFIMRLASYTACLLLLASVASVRFSPAVAAYVSEIPGFRSFVQLIHYDRGLELALENGFMQPLNLSDEHDGIKLTVDGILADESRVIIFYTLNNVDGRKRVINLHSAKVVNNEDTSSSFGSSHFEEEWESKQGTIDLHLREGAGIPDTLKLELQISENNENEANGSIWRYEIPVDVEKFAGLKEKYEINRTVNIEGQSITFENMIVYPTRIGLEIAYDKDNTKKLFSFDDIRIEDEQGDTFGTIKNGVSATAIDENRQILYFESNYFSKPKQLYLRASSIRALDKNKLEVQVDLDRKELISRPDERLLLEEVGPREEGDQMILVFKMSNEDPLDKNRQYHFIQSDFKDASGKSFYSKQSGSSADEFFLYINKEDYVSPLTLTIADYPTRIHGDINLRIK